MIAAVTPTPPIRVVFASGGTGGHLYPGLAVARTLAEEQPGTQSLFLVSEKPIEASIMGPTEFAYHLIPACPPGWANAGMFLKKLLEGYRRALGIFQDFKPQVVVALGGFASFAPALAARRMGIPMVVQEQNCVAGRANIALSLLAKAVFAPVSGMQRQFFFSRVLSTGNPIRQCALSIDKQVARGLLGLDPDKFTVLVLGGSQGARFMNNLTANSLSRMEDLRDTLQWIHLTGKDDHAMVQEAYAKEGWRAVVLPFFEEVGLCYGACDLIVSRAGASTISEIVANGLASILIPYPTAVRDHQKKNAQVLYEKGAAMMLDQELLTPSSFSTVLRSAYRNPDRLRRMRGAARHLYEGDAAQSVAKVLNRLLLRRSGGMRETLRTITRNMRFWN